MSGFHVGSGRWHARPDAYTEMLSPRRHLPSPVRLSCGPGSCDLAQETVDFSTPSPSLLPEDSLQCGRELALLCTPMAHFLGADTLVIRHMGSFHCGHCEQCCRCLQKILTPSVSSVSLKVRLLGHMQTPFLSTTLLNFNIFIWGMLMLVEVSKKPCGRRVSLSSVQGPGGEQTQAVRLGGRSLDPLSHLAGHILDFLER